MMLWFLVSIHAYVIVLNIFNPICGTLIMNILLAENRIKANVVI